MSRLVRVKFNSASLVIGKPSDKDGYVDGESIVEKKCHYRKDDMLVHRDEIMVFSPIASMLHCLFGYVPVKRNVKHPYLERVDWIDEIARNGIYKITNEFSYPNKFREYNVIESCRQAEKYPWDSYNPVFKNTKTFIDYKGREISIYFEWSRVFKRFCCYTDSYSMDKYKEFTSLLSELTGIEHCNHTCNISFSEVFDIIKNDKTKRVILYDYLTKNKYDMYKKFLENPLCEVNPANQNRTDVMMVKTYVQNIVTLNGEFIFPVTDEQYELLMSGKGVCTYLDGGSAVVDDCYIYDSIDWFINCKNYKKISDLNF